MQNLMEIAFVPGLSLDRDMGRKDSVKVVMEKGMEKRDLVKAVKDTKVSAGSVAKWGTRRQNVW